MQYENPIYKNFLQLALSVSCIICCSQEKKNIHTDNFLDNYTVTDSYADTLQFKSKNVFSVTDYKKPQKGESISATFDGLPYRKESYTEYLRDGRKLFKKHSYSGKSVEEKFHYNKNILTVKETIEDKKNLFFNWIFYNDDGTLTEEVRYRKAENNKLIYEGYSNYRQISEGKKTTVRITDYGYDSIADPEKEYIFEYPFLTKKTPLYQSKIHRYQWMNGKYEPLEIKDYIVENRDVTFNYDKNGRLLSEIWYKNHNSLENKTEFTATDDGREQTEQQYHLLGTEKSLKTVRRFDAQNNLIFEQSTEYTGHILSEITFEYVYDQEGNWISKKQFSKNPDNGANAKKELIDYEYREIKYYNSALQPRKFLMPEFPEAAVAIRSDIPKAAEKKKRKSDAFETAVKNGDFERKITLKKSRSLSDFTPKFWKLKETQSGNLDEDSHEEAVCVYETPVNGEIGSEQSLAIFKKQGDYWILWHQTTNPILSTAHGGMMGNPFAGISIKNKTIIVDHFGGSRQKWNYTHRYRFQNNNWYLIGATVKYGAPCDYFESLDYNLSTGDAVFEYSTEDCSSEVEEPRKASWKEKINVKIPLPLMDDFSVGENSIELKTRKTEMFY